ncbi:MAG: YbjN domain-containing protein [Microcoleaceae cyanobacterium]
MTTETAPETVLIEELTNLSNLQEIETVISGMAVDHKAMVAKEEQGYLWKFQYGSVEVFVRLTGETDDDTFTVWAKVLQLPVANEADLMRKLLEMNWLSTFEGHFAIVDNQVVVLSTRTVAELSPGEIARAITIVATLADQHDDILKAEYQG